MGVSWPEEKAKEKSKEKPKEKTKEKAKDKADANLSDDDLTIEDMVSKAKAAESKKDSHQS